MTIFGMRLDELFKTKKAEKGMCVRYITYMKIDMYIQSHVSDRVTLGYDDEATTKKPHKLPWSAFRVIHRKKMCNDR